jgi:hypothetical protein
MMRLFPALLQFVTGRREAPPSAHWVVYGSARVMYQGQRVFARV